MFGLFGWASGLSGFSWDSRNSALPATNEPSNPLLPPVDVNAPSAPVLDDPATNITGTTATITWSASTDDIGVVGYRIVRNNVFYIAVPATTLTYTFSDLTPGQAYSFYVRAFDAAGNRSAPSNLVEIGTTQTDTTPPSAPVIASPADNITETSVAFHWSASTDNVGVVEYRVYQDAVFLASLASSTLSYTATGLTVVTQYAFTVKAADLAGNVSDASNTLTVTTIDNTAPTAPVIATPADAIATDSVEFHWAASTDNVGVDHYSIYRNGVLIDTVDNATLTYTNIFLIAGTQYAFTVKAFDAAGHASAASNTLTVTTTSSADVTAPTVPVVASPADEITTTTITFHWAASSDAVGVTAYDIYMNGTWHAWVAGNVTSYQATALTQGTQYAFRVTATDAAGNESGLSNTLTVTTTAAADTTPPTAPVIAIPADSITSTSVTFHWSASTDNVAMYRYAIRQDDVTIDNIDYQTLSYTAINLTPSTQYLFNVRGIDTSLNRSVDSNTLTVTTAALPDIEAPTAPVLASPPTNITASSMTLNWSASTDNVGVTGYLVYRGGVLLATLGTVTTYQANGLSSSTQYSWTVKATDLAGNLSASSNTVTATTSASSGFQRPYGPTAAWNLIATGYPKHANSDTWCAILAQSLTWKLDGFSATDWSYPCYYVADSNETYTVNGSGGVGNWNHSQVPWHQAWQPANNASDRQIVLLDESNGREWNFYNVTSIDQTIKLINCNNCHLIQTTVVAGSGSPADYRTKVKGYQPPRGVGIQYLAGLVRPEEIQAGVIEHALSMPIISPNSSGTENVGWINPATKAEGHGSPTGIPEGARFRGLWTDSDINTWLAGINTRIRNAGGSAATSTAIQNFARIIAVAMRDYGWFATDTSGGNHLQCEMPQSANLSRGRVRWLDLGLPLNTAYGGRNYPAQVLYDLVTANNFMAVDGVSYYPSNKGSG